MLPAKANRALTMRSGPCSLFRVEVMGVEPTTSSMRPKRSSQLSYTPGQDGHSSDIAVTGKVAPGDRET